MKHSIAKFYLPLALSLVGLFFFVQSCYGPDSDFVAVNTNKKQSDKPNPDALFAAGQRELVDLLLGTNVNVNIFRLASQYWTETTYTDESNLDYQTRKVPNRFWNIIYSEVLFKFHLSASAIQETSSVFPAQQKNQLAIIDIMNAYAFSLLVETFGDVPYTEIFEDNLIYPKYDDDSTVIRSILGTLDASFAKLDASAPSFGESDLLYKGDVTKWKKFAASLQLRLGMLLSHVDKTEAQKNVDAALTKGCFTSNEDNATLLYQASPPDTHPLWVDLVQSNRVDFVGTDTFVSSLYHLSDPRLAIYFDTTLKIDARDTISTSPLVINKYKGQKVGQGATATNYSQPGKVVKSPTLKGTIFSYSDVEFYLAEAKQEGISSKVPKSAEEHYQEAIKAAMSEWDVPETEITAYLATPHGLLSTPSFGAATPLEKIAFQKWLSLYCRPFEAWTELRRLDYPKLPKPDNPFISDKTLSYGYRFFYPLDEKTKNSDNYKEAISKLPGGKDEMGVKLFWDKK